MVEEKQILRRSQILSLAHGADHDNKKEERGVGYIY